jgi:hypothetical protein
MPGAVVQPGWVDSGGTVLAPFALIDADARTLCDVGAAARPPDAQARGRSACATPMAGGGAAAERWVLRHASAVEEPPSVRGHELEHISRGRAREARASTGHLRQERHARWRATSQGWRELSGPGGGDREHSRSTWRCPPAAPGRLSPGASRGNAMSWIILARHGARRAPGMPGAYGQRLPAGASTHSTEESGEPHRIRAAASASSLSLGGGAAT